MWTRELLKRNAKEIFKRNYWTCVGVSLVLAALTGGGSSVIGRIGGNNTSVSYHHYGSDYYYGDSARGFMISMAVVAVTLIVVAVPEGLPMSVTLSLALNMRRMLSTNNLVRKMHACETMGAITVICTDKTGTLTQNLMQVHEPNFYGIKNGSDLSDDDISALIAEGISANSTAFLEESTNGEKPKGVGNPTEVALLLWLNKQGRDYLQLREQAHVLDQLTFSTERKFMATLVESPLIGKKILYIKGAPEIVLGKCKEVVLDGRQVDAVEYRSTVEAQLLNYQNMAMRTLGFAFKIVGENEPNDCTELVSANDLNFLGVVAISDPIRPDVPAAVAKCQSAGIGIKIVTGDTPGTATEIARQIGLWNPETDTERNRITGVAFAELSDEEALDRVMDLKIMSRARPTDKQRLVQLLQQKGAVVAVTGDGTNDAPALAKADVAVAMGNGTQAAKEAGNMIDLDSSPTKLLDIIDIGKQMLLTRGALTTFSVSNDIAKYFSIIPAAFATTYPELSVLNVMHLSSPESAVLSTVIFNALIILLLIPVAIRGVHYKASSPIRLLRRNVVVYGFGGLIVPFVLIKAIDMALAYLGIF